MRKFLSPTIGAARRSLAANTWSVCAWPVHASARHTKGCRRMSFKAWSDPRDTTAFGAGAAIVPNNESIQASLAALQAFSLRNSGQQAPSPDDLLDIGAVVNEFRRRKLPDIMLPVLLYMENELLGYEPALQPAYSRHISTVVSKWLTAYPHRTLSLLAMANYHFKARNPQFMTAIYEGVQQNVQIPLCAAGLTFFKRFSMEEWKEVFYNVSSGDPDAHTVTEETLEAADEAAFAMYIERTVLSFLLDQSPSCSHLNPLFQYLAQSLGGKKSLQGLASLSEPLQRRCKLVVSSLLALAEWEPSVVEYLQQLDSSKIDPMFAVSKPKPYGNIPKQLLDMHRKAVDVAPLAKTPSPTDLGTPADYSERIAVVNDILGTSPEGECPGKFRSFFLVPPSSRMSVGLYHFHPTRFHVPDAIYASNLNQLLYGGEHSPEWLCPAAAADAADGSNSEPSGSGDDVLPWLRAQELQTLASAFKSVGLELQKDAEGTTTLSFSSQVFVAAIHNLLPHIFENQGKHWKDEDLQRAKAMVRCACDTVHLLSRLFRAHPALTVYAARAFAMAHSLGLAEAYVDAEFKPDVAIGSKDEQDHLLADALMFQNNRAAVWYSFVLDHVHEYADVGGASASAFIDPYSGAKAVLQPEPKDAAVEGWKFKDAMWVFHEYGVYLSRLGVAGIALADAMFQEVIHRDGPPDVLFSRAVLLHGAGATQQAIELLEEFIKQTDDAGAKEVLSAWKKNE